MPSLPSSTCIYLSINQSIYLIYLFSLSKYLKEANVCPVIHTDRAANGIELTEKRVFFEWLLCLVRKGLWALGL